ncbi:MAG: ASCH domain-containing protein [Lachnospiraceae bacterium]|nr:ASCH domain-containing protein [Lachnospiraceae bacterium]
MMAEELWRKFCHEMKIDEATPYEAWAFSNENGIGDNLLDLVLRGRKFGTASAYDEYVEENALNELPEIGDYSVLLRSNGEAVCVIRNYDVYIRPFESVPPFHAYAEGEGDGSLQTWKDIHTKFFVPRLQLIDKPLNEKSLIVCEKFTLEYTVHSGVGKRNEIFFVEPSMAYAEEITAYREEMLAADSSFDGCFSMKRMPDPKEYVEYCTEWTNPSRLFGLMSILWTKKVERLSSFF